MNTVAEIFSETQLQSLLQSTATPRHFRLYYMLKNAILDGTIDNGKQLPSEIALAKTFAVSTITAKRAMDELATEELVKRQRSKGNHVIYEYSPQPINTPLTGLLEEIENTARHSDSKVLECNNLLPQSSVRDILNMDDEEQARQLETKIGTPLINLTRHSFETRGEQERLVDYMKLYYHPERFQCRIDLRLDDE